MIKRNCVGEEATRKAEIRKAAQEKCFEFMKGVQQIDLIGSGTFGEIRTMKVKGHDSLLVQKISRCIKDIRGIQAEAMVLSVFYPLKYIPKLLYSGYTIDRKWCIIMEYFTGGTLWHHIKKEIKRKHLNMKPMITPEQKKYIAYHLALAIEELHSKNFTHG